MTLLISNASFSTSSWVQDTPRGAEDEVTAGQIRPERGSSSKAAVSVRLAMRISRAKWFTFLRKVFHCQNATRSQLGDNPFNSGAWMIFELLALVLQVCVSLSVVLISKEERPVWPMRLWIIGYDFGCVISLFFLYWRYEHCKIRGGDDGIMLVDLEHQRRNDDSGRSVNSVNKCRASLDLYFAMWFVMGNVWVFDTRFRSFNRAPKLHILCITILSWNAITYSFPLILFLLLCICVPLVSTFIGYNMSLGSSEKGASDEQISELLCWRYKQVEIRLLEEHPSPSIENHDCCICLTKYKEKEEIRQLPCFHIFHKKCVDHWLKIISCCPLCKQGLDK